MTPRELIKILEKSDQTLPVVFAYEEYGGPEDSCGYTVVRDIETAHVRKMGEIDWQCRSKQKDEVVIVLQGSDH